MEIANDDIHMEIQASESAPSNPSNNTSDGAQAVDARLIEFQNQLPAYIEKFNTVFTAIMETFREATITIPDADRIQKLMIDKVSIDILPEEEILLNITSQLVCLQVEGEVVPLSELLSKIRTNTPAPFAEKLPATLTAFSDLILSKCDRKGYGLSSDQPRDPAVKLEAPAYPALLIWEAEMKNLTTILSIEEVRRIESKRRDRKEFKLRLIALERLIKEIQFALHSPQINWFERIVSAREKVREFEKKDEKMKQAEEARIAREREKEESSKRKFEEIEMKKAEVLAKKFRAFNEKQKNIAKIYEERQKIAEEKQREKDEKQRIADEKQREKEEKIKSRVSSSAPVIETPGKPKPQGSPKTTLFNFFKKSNDMEISTSPACAQSPIKSILFPESLESIFDYWRGLRRNFHAQGPAGKEGSEVNIPGWTGEMCSPWVGLKNLNRRVFVSLHDRARPCVRMNLGISLKKFHARKRSQVILEDFIDYDRDTDEEWEEIHNAEDIGDEADEEGEEIEAVEEGIDDEEDSFVVADGVFGEGDAVSEDEQELAKKSSVNPKEISIEGKSLKPVGIDERNPQINNKWSTLLSQGSLDVQILNDSQYFVIPAQQTKQPKQLKSKEPVFEWTSDLRKELAALAHGRTISADAIISEFENKFPGTSGAKKIFKEMIKFSKPEGAKQAWYVVSEWAERLELKGEQFAVSKVKRSVAEVYPSVADAFAKGA